MDNSVKIVLEFEDGEKTISVEQARKIYLKLKEIFKGAELAERMQNMPRFLVDGDVGIKYHRPEKLEGREKLEPSAMPGEFRIVCK